MVMSMISWDVALKFLAFHTHYRHPGLKLGICRSDKTIALRHSETLNFPAFPWPGRIPDQAGDDVSEDGESSPPPTTVIPALGRDPFMLVVCRAGPKV